MMKRNQKSHRVLRPLQGSTIDPTPSVKVHLHADHGSCHVQVLPNSGAEILAAGEHILPQLNEYKDNLLPSEFTPRGAIWTENACHLEDVRMFSACWL